MATSPSGESWLLFSIFIIMTATSSVLAGRTRSGQTRRWSPPQHPPQPHLRYHPVIICMLVRHYTQAVYTKAESTDTLFRFAVVANQPDVATVGNGIPPYRFSGWWVDGFACEVMLMLRYWDSLVATSVNLFLHRRLVPLVGLVAYILTKIVCFSHKVCRTVAIETGLNMAVASNIMLLSFSDSQVRGCQTLVDSSAWRYLHSLPPPSLSQWTDGRQILLWYGVCQMVEGGDGVFQAWVFSTAMTLPRRWSASSTPHPDQRLLYKGLTSPVMSQSYHLESQNSQSKLRGLPHSPYDESSSNFDFELYPEDILEST
ncbi:putative ileal sodium/bile acid cotransporter-like [Homarus americanus]|uniref:Putative ileal sodium/bile acid cotransporter-like n=1 Tax=Homarus americanus TaxID=6706 RepID=A0A8J5K2B1_HOMAM|nr:putative ileal sodium/bile acid cotransporter-like [Homarus americanus]